MYKSVICAGQGGTFSAYLEVVADGDVSLRRKTAIRSEPEFSGESTSETQPVYCSSLAAVLGLGSGRKMGEVGWHYWVRGNGVFLEFAIFWASHDSVVSHSSFVASLNSGNDRKGGVKVS